MRTITSYTCSSSITYSLWWDSASTCLSFCLYLLFCEQSWTSNVASREFIDSAAPNPELCVQYGASAMVMDTRLFVTLNPFNVYVSQPNMRPGCVLRTNNWSLLEQRNLVTSDQVRDCKNRMNTFGFTGDLGSSPAISCIYQNEAAQNFFINQPGAVGAPTETDKF